MRAEITLFSGQQICLSSLGELENYAVIKSFKIMELGEKEVEEVVQKLKGRHIEKLELHYPVTLGTIGPILRGVVNNKYLKHLSIHSILDWLTMREISNFITKHKNLEILDLSNNDIDIKGIISLSIALSNSPSLQELDLSHSLPNFASIPIALALKSNHALKRINLSHNNIKESKSLAYMIANNESLQFLNISHNHLGARGIKHIISALSLNHSLKEIQWENNQIKDHELPILQETLQQEAIRRPLTRENLFSQLQDNIILTKKTSLKDLIFPIVGTIIGVYSLIVCGAVASTLSLNIVNIVGLGLFTILVSGITLNMFRQTKNNILEYFGAPEPQTNLAVEDDITKKLIKSVYKEAKQQPMREKVRNRKNKEPNIIH